MVANRAMIAKLYEYAKGSYSVRRTDGMLLGQFIRGLDNRYRFYIEYYPPPLDADILLEIGKELQQLNERPNEHT